MRVLLSAGRTLFLFLQSCAIIETQALPGSGRARRWSVPPDEPFVAAFRAPAMDPSAPALGFDGRMWETGGGSLR